MNETYLGPEPDRRFIAEYLKNIRLLDPIEIVTLPNSFNLTDHKHLSEIVDVYKFWELVNKCLALSQQLYSVNISSMKPERYYTAVPTGTGVIGGFHDLSSFGYQYWYQASFVVALNKGLISKQIRTIELARSFLHDCFHHSTFRSFRRVVRVPAKSLNDAKHRVPELYREQYGINFRNHDGLSYSSPDLTARSPETINLNLLMDGVIVIITADLLKTVVKDVLCENDIEKEIVKEIFLEPFDTTILHRPSSFYNSITNPTKKFVEYWGGKSFSTLLLQSMVGGELSRIKLFFDMRAGVEGAWEKMFKRPEFSLLYNQEV